MSAVHSATIANSVDRIRKRLSSAEAWSTRFQLIH